MSLPLVAHLPGKHDQSTHGKGGGGRSADELLDGTAEEKDTAMRSVFEGKFGKYTTKVTSTGGRDGVMWAEGTIHSRGMEVGRFSRSISRGRREDGGDLEGKIYANHSLLEMDSKRTQGSGFAAEFNGRAVDFYRTTGVDRVYLDAHSVGKYAWASQGFDFQSPKLHMDELRENVSLLRAGRSTNQYGETIPKKLRTAKNLDRQLSAAESLLARAAQSSPGRADYPTAYEFSQLGRSPGQGKNDLWLGKSTLLNGSTWQGVLYLSGGK